ncbi:hypothetical protein BH23GEM7_BH23GEM7_17960 [soil metagenome]
MDTTYAPPVDQLLTLGDPDQEERRDYLELGVGEEHIPDLIRMATDRELIEADYETAEYYAPMHAWYALGQLRAEAAIEPLIARFHESDEDDWVAEELPEVFAMIGPAAIPALSRYLQDRSQPRWPRMTAATSLKNIARDHPETRGEVVAALVEQLDRHAEEEGEFNAFLLGELLEMKATEAAPAIERAFAAGSVDESISGDWEDAQVELGLLEERVTPRPRYNHFTSLRPPPAPEPPVRSHQAAKKKARTKAKKKMAKQSRKQNRKRR